MTATPPDGPEPARPDPYKPPLNADLRPTRRRSMSMFGVVGGLVLVGLSCVIGFMATCIPLGFIAANGPEEQFLAARYPFYGGLVGGIITCLVTVRLAFRKIWQR